MRAKREDNPKQSKQERASKSIKEKPGKTTEKKSEMARWGVAGGGRFCKHKSNSGQEGRAASSEREEHKDFSNLASYPKLPFLSQRNVSLL